MGAIETSSRQEWVDTEISIIEKRVRGRKTKPVVRGLSSDPQRRVITSTTSRHSYSMKSMRRRTG
jgi:hypothetical protein